jgi:hypothetical protein
LLLEVAVVVAIMLVQEELVDIEQDLFQHLEQIIQ